jgi:glyoxylase-like metal-dependent hydrolase (beta-lactamase superfamily II)
MRSAVGVGFACALAWLCGPGTDARVASAAAGRDAGQSQAITIAEATGLEVLQLRPNFFLIAGAGGHIAVQTGDDGVVVVDAGSADKSPAVLAAIKRLSPRPIRYIINTSADGDHVGGNEAIAKAGQTLFTNQGSISLPGDFIGGAASILAAEGVLRRMSAPTGQASPYPGAAWPTETFDHARKYMYLNGEGIEVLHPPAAHTDGDVMVFFRRSDVVVAGDIIDTTRFPAIDIARGGSIQGEIAALNRLVDLAIPSVPIVSREAGTIVVPGHGRLCDQFDVVEYRDMVTIVRDRVQELVDAGRSLEQVKSAFPARGYTRRYGGDKGAWTNQFVEAVYAGLATGKKR